jgi:type II secretory pathway component PulM
VNAFLQRLRDAFEGLKPNERLLVGVAGAGLLAALVWLVLVQPILSQRDASAARIQAAELQIRTVEDLAGRYAQVAGRLDAVEQRIRSGPRGEIFTTLEQLAQQSAVKVDAMEPRTTPASDAYQETKVQVGLKDVTLAQLVGYLHRIESAPQLLSIKTLRIRTRGDKPELLDVTFTVSSFEPI